MLAKQIQKGLFYFGSSKFDSHDDYNYTLILEKDGYEIKRIPFVYYSLDSDADQYAVIAQNVTMKWKNETETEKPWFVPREDIPNILVILIPTLFITTYTRKWRKQK